MNNIREHIHIPVALNAEGMMMTGKKKKTKRLLLLLARYISIIFTPFYLPLMGLLALFLFSYLSMLPLLYKAMVLLVVWLFTCIAPTSFIRLYQHYQGWSVLKLISREGRAVPYIISIGCYFACFYLMNMVHIPHFMSSIVLAALAIQIPCAIINNLWKISTHTAAIGGTTGAVTAFSFLFGFNAMWWICLLIILAGIIGTGRMILRLHTLSEIVGGFLIGVIAGFAAVIIS